MVEREHPAPIPPEGWPCAPPQAPEAMNTTPTPQAAGPVDLLLLAGWPAGWWLRPRPSCWWPPLPCC